jgi:hypothetical protein
MYWLQTEACCRVYKQVRDLGLHNVSSRKENSGVEQSTVAAAISTINITVLYTMLNVPDASTVDRCGGEAASPPVTFQCCRSRLTKPPTRTREVETATPENSPQATSTHTSPCSLPPAGAAPSALPPRCTPPTRSRHSCSPPCSAPRPPAHSARPPHARPRSAPRRCPSRRA